MVVNTRMEEKLAFARRLDAACAELPDCPKDHGRASWLARQFNPSLSAQAVQKWFNGESMPDMTNIPRLAAILRADASWLIAGPGEKFVPEFKQNEQLMDLIRVWDDLGDDGHLRILHFAEVLTLPLPNKDQ